MSTSTGGPDSPRSHDGPRDSVDRFLDGWAQISPDLDMSPIAVVQRLSRVRHIIETEIEATFAEYGLNGPDYIALATLHHLEAAGAVSQRRLMREMGLTSGTISVRVERLSAQGLVTRTVDPADRRNSLVALTDEGRALFDSAAPAHLATEARMLAALDDGERTALAGLLRTLLVSYEGSRPDDDLPRLGLILASAHHTGAMRKTVGLPDVGGLLVRAVERHGRAEQAGIATGDVLRRAGGRELRSITALYAALAEALPQQRLALSLIRGVDTEHDVVLDLKPRPQDTAPGPADHALAPGTHLI